MARLGDVLPSPALSANNSAHRRLVQVVLLGDLGLCERTISNPNDIVRRELALSVSFPTGLASSVAAISGVLGGISEPQMRGLNTDGPVAGVKDVPSVRYISLEDSKRCPMGKHYLHLAELGCAELSVSVASYAGSPVPAPFSGRGARHKPSKGVSLTESLGTTEALPGRRVTVTQPSFVVRVAPVSFLDWLVASFDTAIHSKELCHVET